MVRQLLALIALLTGLAAVGAPAQASWNPTFGIAAEQSSKSESDIREGQTPCPQKEGKQKLGRDKPAPCKKLGSVTVYIPAVMFGVDRAYE